MPSTPVLVILAVIPAAIIILFIFKKDKVEREPLGLLVGLFLMGCTISVFGAFLAEGLLGEAVKSVAAEGSIEYNFIMCFFVVAVSEEGFKFLVLRLRTWKHRAFNYTFDAIVYAVIVSLGFATLENILYLTKIGTYQVALVRGLLSVPGHAIDAVFMGLYYGKAKYCMCCGDRSGKNKYIFLSLFIPILTHGFYDFCLFSERNIDGIIVVFFIFEIIVTIVAFVTIHKSSKGDTAIPGMGTPFYQLPYYPYNYYQNQYQQGGYNNAYQYQNYQQPQYQYQYQNYQQGYQQNYQQSAYQYQNYQQPQYQQAQQNYYSAQGGYGQANAQYQTYQSGGYSQPQGQYYGQGTQQQYYDTSAQGQYYDPSAQQQGQYQGYNSTSDQQ